MFDKNKGKKKTPEIKFDMENDLSDPVKLRKSQEEIATKIQKLKNLLRQGENKKTFDQTQAVLTGMLAAQKVINRINRR